MNERILSTVIAMLLTTIYGEDQVSSDAALQSYMVAAKRHIAEQMLLEIPTEGMPC